MNAPARTLHAHRHLSLGVLGHVDHGKTSLVKALTGTDTDRLEEEKRRGMSIVLGFAYLSLASAIIDIIDVPGHEQFVRTMVAGATGIDAALLVVDAREGIKPQTMEHLAIAGLVGVRRGVVAVTKADLADDAQRRTLPQRLRPFLAGGPLASAPVVFTSTVTGEGLDALRAALEGLAGEQPRPAPGPNFTLPVDRVFALPGHGTVVTGTLRGGCVRSGDHVAVSPGGARAVIRQLQVHNQVVEEAWPGQRVGINLRQLGAGDLHRGDLLAPPGLVRVTSLIDAELRLLPEHLEQAGRLADGQRLRLLFGTTDVSARVRLLDTRPETTGLLVQLRTERPVAAMPGDAFILRRDSPPQTLGGGRFLDTAAPRHRAGDDAVLGRLRILASGDWRQVMAERLRAAGPAGLPLQELARSLGCHAEDVRRAADGFALCDGKVLLLHDHATAIQESLLGALGRFHREQPLRSGAPLSYCRSSLPAALADTMFRKILSLMHASGRVVCQQGTVRLAGHDPLAGMEARERAEAEALERRVLEGGMTPPDLPCAGQRGEALLRLLAEHGRLVLLPGQLAGQRIVFHREAIAEAERKLREAFPAPARFTVSQAREVLGSSRKFVVPLLEHFDARGRTRRHGDNRVMAASEDRQNGGA
ncbi:selenocysteine-specific translation elongation factor [Noviherbaspirillum galbum]|uniref:Selenocysteine-specific elongation factor n=1 Tax=Noviherbaspirillum galbum TaxID=2709383 RepID=A0A6B3SUA5_9BURK|nr:selenocysteine-specific translation elongation factor [Noviherbaspirillum galbum]NEX64590.1 selenocysteine-specific translation elongation factor [Noviherbaspirillum galbum]